MQEVAQPVQAHGQCKRFACGAAERHRLTTCSLSRFVVAEHLIDSGKLGKRRDRVVIVALGTRERETA